MTARFGRWTILTIYAVIIIVPLMVVVFGTFKTQSELFSSPFGLPSSLSFDNYTTVLSEQNLGRSFLNSVIVTACSVSLTLFTASLAAYGISRIPGWAGHLLFGFLVLGMAVPAQATMIPQYVLFQRLDLLDSRLGLVLIYTVVTLPVAVFILTGFMRALPAELFDASAVDGAGAWRTYRSIVIPLSLPALAATGIFLFVMHWNDLLYALLFVHDPAKKTLPLALLNFTGEFLIQYPLLFSGVVIASAPIIVSYVFLQRYFVAGMTAGALKG